MKCPRRAIASLPLVSTNGTERRLFKPLGRNPPEHVLPEAAEAAEVLPCFLAEELDRGLPVPGEDVGRWVGVIHDIGGVQPDGDEDGGERPGRGPGDPADF